MKMNREHRLLAPRRALPGIDSGYLQHMRAMAPLAEKQCVGGPKTFALRWEFGAPGVPFHEETD